MPAAASRQARVQKLAPADRLNAIPHFAAADDTALLNALPIAAAVVERNDKRKLEVTLHNSRFLDTVDKSKCTALDWNEADCLKQGAIADLIHSFFDGTDPVGELDFKQGEGVS
jgi:hypothetical protein